MSVLTRIVTNAYSMEGQHNGNSSGYICGKNPPQES